MSERWDEIQDVALRQMEAEMAGDLRNMREAATLYAERAWGRASRPVATRSGARAGQLGWAGAGVLAIVLVGGGLRVMHHSTDLNAVGVEHGGNAAAMVSKDASAVSDEALLEQIQSDLSTGVPAAMQPLEASDSRASRYGLKRSE